ncbi:uncharacterized protein [Aristolochia californica]|uniref:uncharacterized protein n=1 Tax=Aristolochia californica TaxID=171875 RepID=UPI0035E1A664
MEYENKHVLAPMVLVGTLPFRLLAAEYGADITYGEEIIDLKMLKCEWKINGTDSGFTQILVHSVVKSLKTILFSSRVSCYYRFCVERNGSFSFQDLHQGGRLGTSDSVRALAAAQMMFKDVAAIDINMGCPKSFSISGGMGVALLSKPELIDDILTTLRRNLDTPVTCKIRLLRPPQDTIELDELRRLVYLLLWFMEANDTGEST